MDEEQIYDGIIIGAGPGGLQASVYLGRYNRKVLLIDRGGGRTSHAKSIENFLTQKAISGREMIRLGLEQARSFNVRIEKGTVTNIIKSQNFEVYAGEIIYHALFVIVSTGATENFPPIDQIYKFLGTGFYTCIDCDGYKTTGKKLVVIGNSIKTLHLAFGMKEMYTKDITVVLYNQTVPEEYMEELRDEDIRLITGRPVRILGQDKIEGIEMRDGQVVECEAIMSNFGFKLNDEFLSNLNLKRDRDNFKYITNSNYESSMDGLYIVGPLTGNDQAIIAAGEGAIAAIDLKRRLLER
jgi:thioredoxin reductase (NADPH)